MYNTYISPSGVIRVGSINSSGGGGGGGLNKGKLFISRQIKLQNTFSMVLFQDCTKCPLVMCAKTKKKPTFTIKHIYTGYFV